MKRKMISIASLAVMLTVLVSGVASADNQADLGPIRAATATYHQLDVARAAGYRLVPGLDYCFNNPSVGGMGYHYINTGILDLNVDPLQPEALVYTPGPNGSLQLGAVEYLIPIALWDEAHPQGPAPTILGRTMERDVADGVYEQHVWLWQENPLGIFEDWNPKVTCP